MKARVVLVDVASLLMRYCADSDLVCVVVDRKCRKAFLWENVGGFI